MLVYEPNKGLDLSILDDEEDNDMTICFNSIAYIPNNDLFFSCIDDERPIQNFSEQQLIIPSDDLKLSLCYEFVPNIGSTRYSNFYSDYFPNFIISSMYMNNISKKMILNKPEVIVYVFCQYLNNTKNKPYMLKDESKHST